MDLFPDPPQAWSQAVDSSPEIVTLPDFGPYQYEEEDFMPESVSREGFEVFDLYDVNQTYSYDLPVAQPVLFEGNDTHSVNEFFDPDKFLVPPKGPVKNTKYNRNPTGKNQHPTIATVDDPILGPILCRALYKYHRELKTNNQNIAQRLVADYGERFKMSASSVARTRRRLVLVGSRKAASKVDSGKMDQLIMNVVGEDHAGKAGVGTIRSRIAYKYGVHLTFRHVSAVMHTHAPDGFHLRTPNAKKINRYPKHPVGINWRWSADGHDKLNKIGFPIWAIVDDDTSRWLRVWVIPNNRVGIVVAYMFLSLVLQLGGIPMQFITDCGSETTVIYGIINSLRQQFFPEFDPYVLPPHILVRSVNNITVERGWYRLRLDIGDTIVIVFMKGVEEGIYDPANAEHYELCQWLWSQVVDNAVQESIKIRNATKMRRDDSKPGPSGMSRDDAYALPEQWGGSDKLLKLPEAGLFAVRATMEALGGEDLLAFSSRDFDSKASEAYDSLKLTSLTLENAWDVFQAMLPLLYPHSHYDYL